MRHLLSFYVSHLYAVIISSTATLTATPSPYPSGACPNEPRYLNFDFNKAEEAAKADKLHTTFCTEWRSLMSAGASILDIGKRNRNLIRRYFDLNGDGINDGVAIAASVMNQLFDLRTGYATSQVGAFIFDNEDFLKAAGNDRCAVKGTAAYVEVDQGGDDLEKIHFCDETFTEAYPPLSSFGCQHLPNSKITDDYDTFGRLLVHEFFHYKAVGEASLEGFQIIDRRNNDGLAAYFPERVHGLLAQDKNPEYARDNADNFAWLATVCSPCCGVSITNLFFRAECVYYTEMRRSA